ncbi:SUN domain-containing protein 1 isoform X2 [Ambystoma mexicanum]|uniref:SUN domain-containing protein 1 isoform X2 n=1 Tax=Ambystoma mexicanum TaxID=8296 RepID=UPI0037E89572
MDFSHLHTYAPPQCAPDNTGYTYSLSSSYSTAALDFETKNKLNPVYDSPRMSRRSLRLVTTAGYYANEDIQNDSINSNSFNVSVSSSKSSRTTKQQRNINKQSTATIHHTPRKNLSNTSLLSHSSLNSHLSDTSLVSTVLDETLIREQTEVDHFWGLDDDGDLRVGESTMIQANGGLSTAETQTTLDNGYTCNDCSMLSEQKDTLAAYSTQTSTVYSRDRSHKQKSGSIHFKSKILQTFKNAAKSFGSLFMQLFQMVSLKLGCESKVHSNYCGSMNVKELLKEDGLLRVNGDSLCDDCKGKKQLESHTTTYIQSSSSKRVARTIWHTFSYAGKAASRSFWWLGTGWYQLVTWISLFNVFLLTRCLPKAFKLLLLLIPLLLLFGLWYSGLEGIMSLLPLLIGANVRTEKSEESSIPTEQPDFSGSCPPPKITMQFDSHRVTELEQQIAVLSGKYHLHIEEYSKVVMTLQKVEQQVAQMDDKSGMSAMITNILSQHFKAPAPGQGTFTMDEFQAFHKNHDERILKLEDIFAKLATKSEELKQELEIVKSRSTASALDEENESLMKKVQHLELELAEIKSELLNWQGFKTSCEKIHTIQEQVDAQIKDSVKVMFFGNREDELPESLLQWLSSKCVSKSEFQPSLLDLELRIFKNISHYVAATNKMPDLDVVQSAVTGGISGITAEQARIIVNNALKLYSQDKTGMVDYALESGGGSILSTRCSETYETKTALMSLFGIPLWYFSQSPRVVIQPDMYPGNCWAFKGSQGYLVVRLSMKIYPAAFTLEHIPKTLSPTGNITSAPKDFTVYGLEDEYQEEGKLLGQYTYNQEGEPLQTFQVTEENESAFQIVELRILSNWGHTEYTCLYRFRVHGSNDI